MCFGTNDKKLCNGSFARITMKTAVKLCNITLDFNVCDVFLSNKS